jgi:hypothetical protein
LIGVKEQEAFQIQDNAATFFYALMYLVLFAIPLIAINRFGVSTPLWLKIAAASGFIVSVIAGFYTMIPITTVEHPGMFAAKIIVVVVVANGIGIVLYFLGRKRAERSAGTSATT